MRNQRILVRYLLLAVFLMITASATGIAQGCPTIQIETPAKLTIPGESFVVSAIIKNAVGLGDFKYNWTVSAGVIESGQGSPSIKVLTTREQAGTNVSVNVMVAGLASFCERSALEKVGIAQIIGCYRPLDEFGADKASDVKARVDNIYIVINNNPDFRIMFEMEFIEAESIRERILRINRILNAIQDRKYDPSKVTFVISNEKGRTSTRVWGSLENTYMSEWANRGVLINGRDMKQKLSTLFQ